MVLYSNPEKKCKTSLLLSQFSPGIMNIEEYREFCLSLKDTEEKFPFDENTLVFSIRGKMFSLTDTGVFDFINVKCDPEKAIALRERYDDVLPGYHMNKNHWNSIRMNGSIPDTMIKDWIKESYSLVISGLPKRK